MPKKCKTCQHAGADVDADAACHFCRVDANNPTSSRHMHALLAALGKKAPSVEAKKPAPSKARLYTPTAAGLGLDDDRAVWRALMDETLGDPSPAEGYDRVMRGLAIVRAACFSHDRASYTVADCVLMRTAFEAGETPKRAAMAIAKAKDDPFYAKAKGITFPHLREKIPQLLAAQSAAATTAKDVRAQAIKDIADGLVEVRRCAPLEFARLDVVVENMSTEALVAHAAAVKKEIAKWT